ncbi:benzoylformate decarboxylase [Paracraurococcus lichenis]|uniref:Benzoylformate decarboxylase n=1 Tax=Paracraurococcus lichenis TaxID=3064888 RepID=A0ABT9E4B3_9PROT|nr:benzoylformate decarboxylase [Paracraurococcus sp. LOR1-02]MDO9711006.1 benzoylformate decarboxylase [Paracraurococcus sp. LOR1-02]
MADGMTVRQATMDLLRDCGMTTVFGNPGSTELGFLDRWPNDVRYVLGLQEASVVAMADGYARASGRAALCNLHSAAGVGHALGNVFTAYRNQAPLVITAGQQARSLMPFNPFLGATDAASFPKPYVKWSCEPARAEDVPAALAHAFHIAMQRPHGPTFVSIPSDDWGVPTHPLPPRRVSQDMAPDPALLADCAQALAAARNPVLVIGPEVDAEGAGEAAVALAEALRAPVWASPFSARLSFPEDHALFAGHLAAAPPAVSKALATHDLVLVLGAPVFTFHVAGNCALFAAGTPLFQITPDGEALAAAGTGTGIQGSLRLALPALAALLPATDRAPPPPRARPAPPAASRPMTAEYLFHALSRLLPAEAIVVEEAPSHRPAMQQHLPIRRWGGFYTMTSGGLGYSLPASVGIALAHPGRRICAIIGDGSMMYSIQALWTAAQHALPITTIVLNNSGYGAMRSFSRVLGTEGVPGIDLPGLDFVALAQGMGCAGLRVEDPALLADALAAALRHEGPMVVDVAVDAAIPTLYHKA